MSLKKSQKATASLEEGEKEEGNRISSVVQDETRKNTGADGQLGEKRKDVPTSSSNDEPPSKSAKIKSSPSSRQQKIIEYILSPAGLELCRNKTADAETYPTSNKPEGQKDYFSTDLLTPFEHLLCAVILSRPLSHNLGQRTIRTVLNPPWSWNNAAKILEAGKENEEGKTERVEAMEQSRTQHRQKTAAELGEMAMKIEDEGWDDGSGALEALREKVKGRKMVESLRKEVMVIKGVGQTAADIFLRRVQGCEGWEGIGWFVDGKTKEALEGIGLPGDGDELEEILEGMGTEGKDLRRTFVAVLERGLGISLEGKQVELTKNMKMS